jgi:hypothetical protein
MGGARWVLRRALVALVVALAVAVVVRQFTDGGGAGESVLDVESGPVEGPRIGEDHWHAFYQVVICGQRQPPFAFWEGGVHTHDDSIIHIHPVTPEEENAGARLVKWFEYGGGLLTQTELRMPGDATTYRNGDECPNGGQGVLQVFVNGEELDDWQGYIPRQGDTVVIAFGPRS